MHEKVKVAGVSVFAAVFLTTIKLVIGLLTGSHLKVRTAGADTFVSVIS